MSAVIELLETARIHFQKNLVATPDATRYLAGRGIGGAIARKYGVGFAAYNSQDLGSVFRGFSEETIDDSGLLTEINMGTERAKFDRFRGRVMFPIRNEIGQTVGFGGRTLGDDEPKYLNSPESSIFKKGELIFGIYEAKQEIVRKNLAVVVEGYLDVISVAQAGFQNVVATLGTACSNSHISGLLKLTKRIVFCFDGDSAGKKAAERVAKIVAPIANLAMFSFAILPDNHDPDSYIIEHGVEAFNSLIENAQPLEFFIMQLVESSCDMRYAEGRAKYSHNIFEYWRLMQDENPAREVMAFSVASKLNMTLDDVYDIWNV